MFHKAVDVKFQNGTVVEVTFQDGKVKQYDMMMLLKKYPQVSALKDRKLFLSGRLMGYYGIIWNEEIDIETETIYECGETIRTDLIASSTSDGFIPTSVAHSFDSFIR